MKDSLLIDIGLPLKFWAKTIDIVNYLCNRLFTKTQVDQIIPKAAWTGERQDVWQFRVFGSVTNIVNPKEKRTKSYIYKNKRAIFIKYSQDSTKHVKTCALKIQQISLVCSLYINKSQQGAKLLANHPLDLKHGSKKNVPIKESKPRERLCKIQATDPQIVLLRFEKSYINRTVRMQANDIELNHETTAEKIMSVSKISSKIYGPLTY